MAALTTARPSGLQALLFGYVSGDVTESAMRRFDDLFADATASSTERAAFARFYLDALAAGDDVEALPTAAEVPGILDAARA